MCLCMTVHLDLRSACTATEGFYGDMQHKHPAKGTVLCTCDLLDACPAVCSGAFDPCSVGSAGDAVLFGLAGCAVLEMAIGLVIPDEPATSKPCWAGDLILQDHFQGGAVHASSRTVTAVATQKVDRQLPGAQHHWCVPRICQMQASKRCGWAYMKQSSFNGSSAPWQER